MHYEMMTVTPELAARWLNTKNARNRNISATTVDAYARDMGAGRWKNSHQNAIAFYKDGNLADGQHRLAAIVKSGVSIDFMVYWGLDGSDAYGIDAHRMRNTHDQIKIAGGSDWIGKDIIATARILMAVSRSGKKVSPQEIYDFCEAHKPALAYSIEYIPKSSFPASVRAAVAAAYYHEDHKSLSDWCGVAVTGVTFEPKGRSAITFRERLHKDTGLRSQGGIVREATCKMAMKSIHAYCKGDILTKMFEPKERIYEIPA
jgi:hypothetical protein